MIAPCPVCGRELRVKGLPPGRMVQHSNRMKFAGPGHLPFRMRCKGSGQPPKVEVS